MSREEAVTVYLDSLLGFRRGFLKYREEADTLTDDDKSILEQAVSGHPACDAERRRMGFFGR